MHAYLYLSENGRFEVRSAVLLPDLDLERLQFSQRLRLIISTGAITETDIVYRKRFTYYNIPRGTRLFYT
jgi:hypothetical protein